MRERHRREWVSRPLLVFTLPGLVTAQANNPGIFIQMTRTGREPSICHPQRRLFDAEIILSRRQFRSSEGRKSSPSSSQRQEINSPFTGDRLLSALRRHQRNLQTNLVKLTLIFLVKEGEEGLALVGLYPPPSVQPKALGPGQFFTHVLFFSLKDVGASCSGHFFESSFSGEGAHCSGQIP